MPSLSQILLTFKMPGVIFAAVTSSIAKFYFFITFLQDESSRTIPAFTGEFHFLGLAPDG